MNRRRFLKCVVATAGVIGASALGFSYLNGYESISSGGVGEPFDNVAPLPGGIVGMPLRT